jgi:hypothetical protein
LLVQWVADGPLQESGDIRVQVGALLAERVDGNRQDGGELLQVINDLLQLIV